jgi:uncharacterized membrane protein YphA (DoxX/SURF4 family)
MAASSRLQGTAENAFPLDSQQSQGAAWNVAHRVMFRFVFSFLVLAIFPFPFNSFGGSVYPTGFYERMWFAAASWLSEHVLHLLPTPSVAVPFLLVDNINGYVELLCFVVLAALAAIVWTFLDRKRPDYRSLHEWLRIYVRYALAFTMLGYGMDKVFALQFNWSLPGPGRLAEPLGNYSPMALMWTFMGYSKPYTIFAGAGEVLGGVLLLFGRTTTLGALVICGVMGNVVALDFSYGVGVKILSSLFLLLAIFLLASDLPRLINVFVLNRPAPAANLESPILKTWMKKPRLAMHAALVVFALYFFAGPGLRGPRERGNRPKSSLYGLYQVEAFTQNGRLLTQNDANWRRVIFEGKGDMTVLTMDDDSMHYYGADVDTAKNTVTISGEYAEMRSRSQAEADSGDNSHFPKSILTYSWPDPDHLELRGDLANQPIVTDLRKIDTSKFTLVSRGFHWVENGGFYR